MSPPLNAITQLGLVALVACTPRTRRTPDDTLVVVLQDRATTIDPRYSSTNYDAMLRRLVVSGLTSVDTPTAAAELDLASRIERVDELTVDITVRDGARFSDGSAVTADDVARTYRTVLDDRCGSLFAKGFHERFASIEVRGANQLRLHLVQPLGTLMTDLELGIVSFHGVPPGACSPPSIVGAGPYVLRELSSTGARLDANPFAAVPPRIPHLDIRFVSDAAARILMLVGGSADLVQNGVRLDLVDDVAERPRVRVADAPSLLLSYMLLNNDDPVLHDRRVREAIALALDRPAIVAAKLGGRAVLATGLLPPTHWAYNPDVTRWTRDLARATRLLDEAGLRPDASGVRLRLTYKTSADAFRVAVARAIAAQLAEAGIAVEVRPFEFATMFADVKRGNYQLATMQTTPITEPDFYYFYFHSSRIPDANDPDGGNRWRYRNPVLDRLVEAGRREVDPARRRPIYAEAQRIVADDLPIIPLWHEANVVLTNADVRGYQIAPSARLAGLVGVSKSH